MRVLRVSSSNTADGQRWNLCGRLAKTLESSIFPKRRISQRRGCSKWGEGAYIRQAEPVLFVSSGPGNGLGAVANTVADGKQKSTPPSAMGARLLMGCFDLGSVFGLDLT